MTKVINLFAGPGCGKSSTAAALFAEMKLRGYSVELVREVVKDWAYEGKVPCKYDQVYLFGAQARSEYILYGQVDYVITDSPVLLCGFYEQYHLKRELTYPSIVNFLEMAKQEGTEHINLFLKRHKPFVQKGRYQTEEQSKQVDIDMKQWLASKNVEFIEIDCLDRERVEEILKLI